MPKTELQLVREDIADLHKTLFMVKQRSDRRRFVNGPHAIMMSRVDADIQAGRMPALTANFEKLLGMGEAEPKDD